MLQIKLDKDTLLSSLDSLDTSTLEAFAKEVSILVAQRKVTALPAKETYLLQQINEGLSANLLTKFNELRIKSKEQLLSEYENKQLNDLVVEIENKETERLAAMLQLAQLRGISLAELRENLGIASNLTND
ncbi:MAG: STAS/SEC14 domain-containing protein [Bacteroidota bacterium]